MIRIIFLKTRSPHTKLNKTWFTSDVQLSINLSVFPVEITQKHQFSDNNNNITESLLEIFYNLAILSLSLSSSLSSSSPVNSLSLCCTALLAPDVRPRLLPPPLLANPWIVSDSSSNRMSLQQQPEINISILRKILFNS